MIRITKNTDIKFSLSDVAGIYEDNFTLSFYTTNANIYKQYTQADVTDGYISITWKGIVMIGGGVLNYICVNHIPDTTFPDKTNDKSFVGTTDYYIVNEDDGTSAIYDVINDEIDTRKKADETLQSEIDLKANKDDVYTKSEVDDKIDNINLTNYYTKSESDTKYATNTALSDLADNVGDLQNTKADKTDLDNYLPLSGGTMNSAATVKFVEDGKEGSTSIGRGLIESKMPYSNSTYGYLDSFFRTTGTTHATYSDADYTTIVNYIEERIQPTYSQLRQYFKNSDISYSFANRSAGSDKMFDNLFYRRYSETNEYYENLRWAGETDCRVDLKCYQNSTFVTGQRHITDTNRAYSEYSGYNGYDKLNVGILDQTNGKVGIEYKYLPSNWGIFVQGKTVNDLMTANGGVKTIGVDIASQASVDTINATLGDISSLLDIINGEEIEGTDTTATVALEEEELEVYTPDLTLTEDKVIREEEIYGNNSREIELS